MADQPNKASLRRQALARRDALDAAVRAEASRAIAERALALPALAGSGPVAGYWPIRSEVDCRPLLQALASRGVPLCLPVIEPPTLRFRVWRPGDALAAGGFGTSGPGPNAAQMRPRVLLVPLGAFDRRGARIGYGKGFYDQAIADLADLAPATIGLAFACQEVEAVPIETHDRSLDLVVTELETIDCRTVVRPSRRGPADRSSG